jgi:hypothetical protein
LSSCELQRAAIILGSSIVAVTYPRPLGRWLDGAVDQTVDNVAMDAWVKLEHDAQPGTFRITASTVRDEGELGLGDALAAFWEQVTFLLIDLLEDALAVHSAAVRRGDSIVLLPGPSGAGKTHLALWYRKQGFKLETDELVTIASASQGADDSMLRVATLARPLFIHGRVDPMATMPSDDVRIRQASSHGEIVWVDGVAAAPPYAVDRGLIVFPRYLHGSPLLLTALTPGQAGLRLIENCVNIRNLPGAGLALAASTARRLPAISLSYGETDQLTDTLDALTDQVLAAAPPAADIASLCAALTARASLRYAPIAVCAPTPELSIPAPAVASRKRRLTVGMATYDDYDGVFFTVQSIRLHHSELADAIEFIVIDNNPGGPCSEALKQLEPLIDGYRYVPRGSWSGTAIRDAVFDEAGSDLVLCVDAHVLIVPGALSRLVDYSEATPSSSDLLQGPMLSDDLRSIATHFEARWQRGMYGVWATDPRGADPEAPAFEIPMQGLGLFACRRDAWPGFNPAFRGFGGEEGYIHEKIRQRGGRTLCLPFLRWVHRFARPLGIPYANRWEDRIRNYVIGFTELGLDTAEIEAHFGQLLGAETVNRVLAEIAAAAPASPTRHQIRIKTASAD